MSRRHELGCGAVTLLGLLATAFLAYQVGAFDGWGERIHVTTVLPDATGLTAGSTVSVAGVPVGQIASLRLAQDGAEATLALRPDAGLPSDSRVAVRARSVLGEKYLAIDRSQAQGPPLVDGARLEAAPAPVEIDQLVGQLGALLDALDPQTVAGVAAALDAAVAEDPQVFERMLRNADVALEQLAGAASDSRRLIARGERTFQAADRTLARFDRRADEVAALLREADGLLQTLERAAEPMPAVADRADAVLAKLDATLAPLTGSGEDLAAVLDALARLDEATVRRLLREDGVRVHLFGRGRRGR